MRTNIVGDVHGCIDELEQLLSTVGVKSDDTWIFAGDIVDKGPDSPAVVKRIRELSKETNVVVLRGNHEINHEKYLRAVESSRKYKTAIKIPQRKLDVIVPIQDKLSDEDREFLLSGPLYHFIPEHGSLVVHAGILPVTPDIPPWSEYETLSKSTKEMIKLHATRGRFCRGEEQIVLKLTTRGSAALLEEISRDDTVSISDLPANLIFEVNKTHNLSAGEFVSLGKEQEGDVFWAEVYDGRHGHVFFGHQPFLRENPVKFPHATGIDLGCVHGNKLCAVILNSGSPGVSEFVTISAKNRYSRPLNADWLPKVPGFTGDE